MNFAVVFAPEAEDQLAELYHYIAAHGSTDTAARYMQAIVTYCEGMSTFPHRGTRLARGSASRTTTALP